MDKSEAAMIANGIIYNVLAIEMIAAKTESMAYKYNDMNEAHGMLRAASSVVRRLVLNEDCSNVRNTLLLSADKVLNRINNSIEIIDSMLDAAGLVTLDDYDNEYASLLKTVDEGMFMLHRLFAAVRRVVIIDAEQKNALSDNVGSLSMLTSRFRQHLASSRLIPINLKWFVPTSSYHSCYDASYYPFSCSDRVRTQEEAWEKTFEKWTLLATDKNIVLHNGHVLSCGLCNLYRHEEEEPCHMCPIKIHTGEPYCHGTLFGKLNSGDTKTAELALVSLKQIMGGGG